MGMGMGDRSRQVGIGVETRVGDTVPWQSILCYV